MVVVLCCVVSCVGDDLVRMWTVRSFVVGGVWFCGLLCGVVVWLVWLFGWCVVW